MGSGKDILWFREKVKGALEELKIIGEAEEVGTWKT